MKAGFCADKIFVSELTDNHLKDIVGRATFPTAAEVKHAIDDAVARAKMARISKLAPAITMESPCASHHFDVVNDGGKLMVIAKD